MVQFLVYGENSLHFVVQVFARPEEEQEDEIFFYAMMFLVIAGGSAITMALMVCNTQLVLADIC